MIERGSGRTSGLTDWQLMDVLSMWACLQDHDTTGHWRQVAGWRKVCDLALAHLSRLREYRRGLAEAWPPETNAAARAYIGELDQLVEKVQRTHDAAAANYDALAAATRAIGSARAELKPIYDEYAVKLQQKRAYEAVVSDPKAAAGSRLPEQPPVTDADLDQLNVQARSLMTGLSGELQQARVMLRQPPPTPKTWPVREQVDPDVYGGAAAPVIPPIVPVPVTASRAVHPASPPSMARPVLTPATPGVGPVIEAGPVLGGASTGLAPSPANPGQPGVTQPGPPVAASGPGNGMVSGLPPSSRLTGRASGSGPLRGQPGAIGRSPAGGANELPHTPPRPLPPGGLIGGTPGMGLGQPGNGATPSRRANPVGGLIGGGGAGTAPTGAAGSRPGVGRASHLTGLHGVAPMGGSPSLRHGPQGLDGTPGRTAHHERDEGESRRWDPDHPWEIDEGVTPVMRPPDDHGPIDPGPAIGFGR